MNKLSIQKRVQIINLLVEGSSLRAASRICDVSINTVTKLLVDVGRACQIFHDDTVRNITSKRVQADEIWSFVYSKDKTTPPELKEKGVAGDAWTWVGIDADSKLVISWFVGNRDAESANEFMLDVAARIKNRVQLTTDGLRAYLDAVENAFDNCIDFAQLVKIYGCNDEKKIKASECGGSKRHVVCGRPDERHVSTNYVERQNLTMRMHMRRFTRLTNAFSKKLENHGYAIALHFVYYNFARVHKSLRVTPAQEAGLTHRIMSIEDIVNLCNYYFN